MIEGEIFTLSAKERQAIERSRAAAARGEFATDEQLRALWRKYGLSSRHGEEQPPALIPPPNS
jgi:hypothetical protein